MPGGSQPYLDTWAPPQYAWGSSGGQGPVRSPGGLLNQATQSTFDGTLHWKLAGTIILALVTVFLLQQLGFRFVVAAGVG